MLFHLPAWSAPDLTLEPSDIRFIPVPNSPGQVTLQATIHNADTDYDNQFFLYAPLEITGLFPSTPSGFRVDGQRYAGQAIIPPDSIYLSRVDLALVNIGSASDPLVLRVRPDDGTLKPSNLVSLSTVTKVSAVTAANAPQYESFVFQPPVALMARTTYWLTMESAAASGDGYQFWLSSSGVQNTQNTADAVFTLMTLTNWVTPSPPSNILQKVYTPLPASVRFYNGNPNSGGTLLGVSTISLPIGGGSSMDASVTISTAALGVSAYAVYVQVDPGNLISESNELNNIAFRSVNSNAQPNVITAPDGTRLSIAANAVNVPIYTVALDVAPPPILAVQAANGKLNNDGDPFKQPISPTLRQITLFQFPDTPLKVTFSNAVTLTIPYSDNGQGFVAGTSPLVQEKNLSIYWLNEDDNLWVRLADSVVDTANNTVTARVPHLSYFMIMGQNAADLSQVYAYPTPFRPQSGHARIKFTGLSPQCTIRVYNVSGALVKTIEESDGDGQNETWDGSDAASGVYQYVVENGQQRKTGKLVIIK